MTDVREPRDLAEPLLLVDDEAEFLEAMADLLTSAGFKVVTALDAKKALTLAKEKKPFLIISDFNMPGMDGLRLCHELRESGFTNGVVLLTGYADKQTAIQSLTAGIDEILEKPIDSKVLRSVVERHALARLKSIDEEQAEFDAIRTQFVEEARELLSDFDSLLLRFEADTLDPIVIDLLCRKIHSVKGGAGAVPQGQELSRLAHQFESALVQLKKEGLRPDTVAIDAFLEAADLCRLHLDLIGENRPADVSMVDQTNANIARLETWRTGVSTALKSQAPKAVENRASAASPVTKSAASDSALDDDEGVFVASDKLDAFMKVSGEMVVLKNTLVMAIRDPEGRTNPAKLEKKLNDFLYAFNKATDALQEQIMSVRKVSLERALSKLPRVVREASRDVGKKIVYKPVGLEFGVDKAIAKALSSSLTHMVRNSIDHGIESSASRAERGKAAEGTLSISAREHQGNIQIIVEDDGGGLDRDRIIRKAIEKKMIDETRAGKMTEVEAFELIFQPGFSTADQVSALSGRGIGMDVVRSAILSLNGRIHIDSRKGEGCRFTLEIPVPKTVMVEQTVVAMSRGTLIAIPLPAISRIVPSEEIRTVRFQESWGFQYENRTVKIIDHRCLGSEAKEAHSDFGLAPKGSVIVLRNKNHYVGMVVDAIYDQLEAVIRPFDTVIRQLPGFRGTTVLGDDQIAYVVSPSEVIQISLGLSEEAA